MDAATKFRDTYAVLNTVTYRARSAQALLDVTGNTLRSYTDNCGFDVPRASDLTPGAPPVRVFDIPAMFRLAAWRRDSGLTKKLPGPGPVVITTTVIKGGTAKSTTAAELGVHLQLMGLRVLMIDLDVQGSLTHLMGYESDLELEEAADNGLSEKAIVTKTFASLLEPFIAHETRRDRNATWPTSDSYLKKPFGAYGPTLIPADAFFDDLVMTLSNARGHRELYIRRLFEAAKAGEVDGLNFGEFDVVIFDCPPALSLLNTNALAAADIAVAPVKLDAFGVKGLVRLMSEMNMIAEAYKLQPKLVILPTHFSPNLKRIGRMQGQLGRYRDYLAPGMIGQSELFPKSLDGYLPLTLQNPNCTPVKEYRVFAQYIHGKIFEVAKEKEKKK